MCMSKSQSVDKMCSIFSFCADVWVFVRVRTCVSESEKGDGSERNWEGVSDACDDVLLIPWNKK